MEKKCFKCGIVKPIDMFYKHSEMGDGHLNKCIECTKKDVHTHRENNHEKVLEYDRNRPNAKQRAEQRRIRAHEKKKNNPVGYRLSKNIAEDKYRKDNREKHIAHSRLKYAIEAGKIKRQTVCVKCGSNYRVEAHHEDYSRPIDVIWLCDTCHKNRHKEIRAEQRACTK